MSCYKILVNVAAYETSDQHTHTHTHTPNQQLHMRPHLPRIYHRHTTIFYFIFLIIHNVS